MEKGKRGGLSNVARKTEEKKGKAMEWKERSYKKNRKQTVELWGRKDRS